MRVASITLFLLLIFGCSSNENKQTKNENWIHLTGEAQGTTFSIKYEEENKKEYAKEIKDIFNNIDRQLSTYIDSSVISKINNGFHCIPPSMKKSNVYFIEVFNLSQEVYKKTKGAFNPAIFSIVEYWGFGKKAETPNEIEKHYIDSMLVFTKFEEIKMGPANGYGEDNLMFAIPNPMKLDFNAIAQGYTVDVIADFLERKGVENYMIEVGGEVLAKGKNDRGEYWKLGIDQPSDINAEHKLQAIIELKNRALATSGNYRKFYEKDGVRYSHTIDPKTGYPVQHSLLSATVLAPDCASADAYATAFMVMGVEKTKRFLKNHPELKLDAYLIYSEKEKFKTWYSSGIKEMIDEDLD